MKFIAAALLAGFAVSAVAQDQHYVKPHFDKNGNYVQGHYQTNPDSSRTNNWSAQGNTNPYTGQQGTVDPYKAANPYAPPQYQQPSQPRCYYNAYGQYVCK